MKKPKVKPRLEVAPVVKKCLGCGREFISKFEYKRHPCKGEANA